MSFPQADRGFPRFRMPAWVSCPALAAEPIPIGDISAGGFGASALREPLEGVDYRVILRVGEAVLGPFQALVAWSREGGPSGLWTFGMLVLMSDERREELAAFLDGLAEAVRA